MKPRTPEPPTDPVRHSVPASYKDHSPPILFPLTLYNPPLNLHPPEKERLSKEIAPLLLRPKPPPAIPTNVHETDLRGAGRVLAQADARAGVVVGVGRAGRLARAAVGSRREAEDGGRVAAAEAAVAAEVREGEDGGCDSHDDEEDGEDEVSPGVEGEFEAAVGRVLVSGKPLGGTGVREEGTYRKALMMPTMIRTRPFQTWTGASLVVMPVFLYLRWCRRPMTLARRVSARVSKRYECRQGE